MRRFAAAPFDAELIERYRAVTLEHLPWVVEELDGVAEAAGVEPLAVFAASVEELEPAAAPTGCSDLVVTGEHTADGHLLVAHNNDLYAEDEEDLVALEWRVDGEPTIFTLGNGPWISVGWNDAGPLRDRQRALPERRAGRNPASAPGPRRSHAAQSGRGGRGDPPSGARVLVQLGARASLRTAP